MNQAYKPAFDFLRQFKEVEQQTEDFFTNQARKKFIGISTIDVVNAFEKGIGGEYGTVYKIEPQVLFKWVGSYLNSKNSSKSYLETGLLPTTHPSYEIVDWDKEANKCYTAFLNGVSESNFHPCIYDYMMLDDKIQLNAYMKYFKDTGNEPWDIMIAKQVVLRNVFLDYKSRGYSFVFFIKD